MNIENYYLYVKAIHIITMTTWMAGLFYLPRLFVYHAGARDAKTSETFKVMEWKLLKLIMNPSFVLTWLFGLALIYLSGIGHAGWLNLKILLVVAMSIFHMYCARQVRLFASNQNRKTQRFFRIINEVPTVLFILIIFLVVIKPNI